MAWRQRFMNSPILTKNGKIAVRPISTSTELSSEIPPAGRPPAPSCPRGAPVPACFASGTWCSAGTWYQGELLANDAVQTGKPVGNQQPDLFNAPVPKVAEQNSVGGKGLKDVPKNLCENGGVRRPRICARPSRRHIGRSLHL